MFYLYFSDSTIEPPVKENIDSAVVRLQNVGALDKEKNLTALGHHLAALPVDVRIGKLMLYGAIFSCVDAALTMAACLNYKSPFVTPFGKKEIANERKRRFAVGNSDQLTALMAYRVIYYLFLIVLCTISRVNEVFCLEVFRRSSDFDNLF